MRVSALQPGDALLPPPTLGYCYRRGHLTVYVNGPMPPALRVAREENRLHDEVLLVAGLPASIPEINLTDCRREFRLLRLAA